MIKNGWVGTPAYNRILNAQLYYHNLTEIRNKQFVTKLTDRDYRTNAQLRSGLFGHIVQQRRDYVLTKPYTCSYDQIKAQFSMYELRRAATDYVACGVMVVGLDVDGKFKRYPPESVNVKGEWIGCDGIKPILAEYEGDGQIAWEGKVEEVKRPAWYTRIDMEDPSLYDELKPFIDAYETLWSRKQDALADMPNSPIVVTGYLDDPDQFVNRVREDGVIFLSKDGSCDEMRVRTDYTEIDKQLDRLKGAIYDIGCAVDMATAVVGNTSSVALRLLYVDLESKAYQLADALMEAIKRTLAVNSLGLSQKEIDELDIVWSFNSIVNENDAIMNCVQSQNLISIPTMLAHHPWVTDVDKEVEALAKEVVFADESSTDDSQELRVGAMQLRNSPHQRNNREDVSRLIQKYVRGDGASNTHKTTSLSKE